MAATAVPAQRVASIRLTRRGRAVLVLALTGGLLGGAISVAGSSFAGSDRPGPSAPAAVPQLRHVVVRSGDTLWRIAAAAAPGSDPRAMVRRIVDLNGLTDAPLVPGQQLVLPAG